jgi:hypothetical protein
LMRTEGPSLCDSGPALIEGIKLNFFISCFFFKFSSSYYIILASLNCERQWKGSADV